MVQTVDQNNRFNDIFLQNGVAIKIVKFSLIIVVEVLGVIAL